MTRILKFKDMFNINLNAPVDVVLSYLLQYVNMRSKVAENRKLLVNSVVSSIFSEGLVFAVKVDDPNFDIENPKRKDGTDFYYGLDYGKLTPYLTKALQETIQKLEDLTSKIKIANSSKSDFILRRSDSRTFSSPARCSITILSFKSILIQLLLFPCLLN